MGQSGSNFKQCNDIIHVVVCTFLILLSAHGDSTATLIILAIIRYDLSSERALIIVVCTTCDWRKDKVSHFPLNKQL